MLDLNAPEADFVVKTPGLDDAYDLVKSGRVRQGMEHMGLTLWYLRKHHSQARWNQMKKGQLAAHPIREVAQKCPVTLRNFIKPRGYAGDAVTLDYIYGILTDQTKAPEGLAAQVYDATLRSECVSAVRFRRAELARLADQAAENFKSPRVLSIAAGHLREFELSEAAQSGKIGEWVAFDQDPESLDVVSNSYSNKIARTVNGNIVDLISGRMKFSNFHLTYAAGLFDYLPDQAARRLIQLMCEATEPGGKVMVANFMPDIQCVGHMEAYMDWTLIYRTEEELLSLFSKVKGVSIARTEIKTDPDRNIAFVTATIG